MFSALSAALMANFIMSLIDGMPVIAAQSKYLKSSVILNMALRLLYRDEKKYS